MSSSIQRMIFIFASIIICNCFAWRQWNYTHNPPPQDVDKFVQWRNIWGQRDVDGNLTESALRMHGPHPRRGHSLVIINNYLVMFGGRDNDVLREVHIPKTYNVKDVNGTIKFTTYDEKPVSACLDTEGLYYSEAERSGCTGNETEITVGRIFNDVWAYNLNCTRYFDGPCANSGWDIWNTGAKDGGCSMELGILICEQPSERWNHQAVYFNDGTMYVYGGFSQRCGDYCDDLWMFDIYLKQWRQVNSTGELSHMTEFADSYGNGGPGKRWRFSMSQDTQFVGANGNIYQRFIVFGGHRLWQGFATENSVENQWNNYTSLPPGGYLSDLWIYTKQLDFTSKTGIGFRLSPGVWTRLLPKEICYADAGVSWSERNDVSCSTSWPSSRAGHAAALDDTRNLLWIFGGYSTFYPYLSSSGPGAGSGTASLSSTGFVPYPSYDYYLNDIWYYNFSSGFWTEIEYGEFDDVPDARFDHVMVLRGEILFMYGGHGNNFMYDDIWYFNLTTFKWLLKSRGVYPVYPSSCTDDIEFIAENNCTHLSWPKHLERNKYYDFQILPASEQAYYYPNPTYGQYWGIVDKDFDRSNHSLLSYSAHPPAWTPIFPFAATGPLQYARKFVYSFNSTTNGTLLSWCTSVWGEPTRGKVVDGLFGRASASIKIAQPRRQRPDWDGCRDRADGRTDLPSQLQYIHPLARAAHRAVMYSDNGSDLILMYGGLQYMGDQVINQSTTYLTTVSDEMWIFKFDVCINNCSFKGDCSYGYCRCWDGYYGADCSNISCPGTFCYYNDSTLEQICVHGCQAGYNHTDADVYVEDIRKVPCSVELPGESNGICDGFGTTMCAPPFLGDDCSTKDCKSNCSYHGWCSIEYPVSRCMCNPGYYGEICDKQICLNNCSYPNGICNSTTGTCSCRMMYSPYNNTREYKPWGGEDCSYLFAYSSAISWHHISINSCFLYFLMIMWSCMIVLFVI